MSYIRCLNNPEGIYIWGDGKYANFTLSSKKGFCEKIFKMPEKTFDGLIKKYNKNYKEDTKYRGAEIKEVFVKTNRLLPKHLWKLIGKYASNFQMRLSYKNWHIDMWLVTWEYIVNNS